MLIFKVFTCHLRTATKFFIFKKLMTYDKNERNKEAKFQVLVSIILFYSAKLTFRILISPITLPKH